MSIKRYAEYQPLALRTEKPLPTVIERLVHAAMGLATESGEIVTELKRMSIYGKSLDDLDKAEPPRSIRQHIAEEIGDTFWYLAIAADAAQLPFFTSTLPAMEPLRRGTPDLERLYGVSLSLPAATGRVCAIVQQRVRHPRIAAEAGTQDLANALYHVAQNLLDAADAIGVPIQNILTDNIEKLRIRFPQAYSNEAAEARADKGGLDARSS